MWLVLSALAGPQECHTRLDTWVDFRPEPSDTTWEVPGGWDKKRLEAFPPHRVAQAELEKSAFKRFPVTIQDALLSGTLPEADGLGEVALKLAWGEPDFVWGTEPGCRALLYGEKAPPELVETCDGEIVGRYGLAAPIACSRLDAVVPRLGKRTLSELDRAQQVGLLAGLPDRWMTEDDLEVAFGEPREKKGSTRTYLDDRGVQLDLTVHLDEAGYAERWELASGPRVGGILPEGTTLQAAPGAPVSALVPVAVAPGPVPPGPAPVVAVAEPAPVAPAPVVRASTLPPENPSAQRPDVPTGRYEVAGQCAGTGLTARVDLDAAGTFQVSARVDQGESTSIAVYRTKGLLRGTAEKLALEGVGTGRLEDGVLAVTLGPWPLASCNGAVLAAAAP
ncbi:MAG: hypothetical protein R3F61_26485 [Myxococcota bacterium]